jgi:D-alanyl-D-alanine carboxypeptidase
MEFGIGSNTKLFTAVALLKLAERNIISLEDSLHEWLPAFANIDSNITLRQIFNHTSGVEDVVNYPGYIDSILANPYRIFDPYELMAWVGLPVFPAGTGWSYSNTNYLLAGMIFEIASAQNIAQFLRDSVRAPLQLDSTFFAVQETVLGTVAHPWQNGVDINNFPRISLNSAAWAAGAMYSTSSEMAQWYHAVMCGRVVNTNSFQEMTTFVGSGNYGFGISEQTIGGRTVWLHGGGIRGYATQMLFDTTLRAIVCVLANSNPAPVTAVTNALLQTLVNNPVTEIHDDPLTEIPKSYSLHQNFPNPFNPNTTFSFSLPTQSFASLKVFDVVGREVAVLLSEELPAGVYSRQWNAEGLPSGVYFYRLQVRLLSGRQAGSFAETKKLILLK